MTLFFEFPLTTRENKEPLSDEGAKGRDLPWTTGDQVRDVLPACRNCTNLEDHSHPCGRIGVSREPGQSLEDGVLEKHKTSALYLATVDGALWMCSYIAGALLRGNYLFNLGAGTGNNVLQSEEVTIVSASGQWVTVRGRNDPRKVLLGISRINPEWPFPDPISGTTAKIQWDQSAISLPVAGSFSPKEPSVLYGKLSPMILEIDPPSGPYDEELEEYEYRVRVWASMDNIKQPYNKKFPPGDGKYTATIGYVGITPERWGNWQSNGVAHWKRQVIELSAEELSTVDGIVELLNSDEESCRILSRREGINVFTVSYVVNGAQVSMLGNDIDTRMQFVDSGLSWATTIDLSSLLSVDGFEKVKISYMAEAVASDGPCATLTRGSCANSQIDYSGSYKHGETRRCADTSCSKFQAGTFRDVCWAPDATKFTLCSPAQAITDPTDNAQLAEVAWNSAGTVLVQGAAGQGGTRDFWFERRIRSSIAMLLGGFCDRVPVSPGAGYTEVLGSRVFGQRKTWTDEDGDHHKLVFGAYDCEDSDFSGAIQYLMSTWDNRDGQLGTEMNDAQKTYPSFGEQACSVVDGNNLGGSMSRRNKKSSVTHQIYVTGINPEATDATVAGFVERIQ